MTVFHFFVIFSFYTKIWLISEYNYMYLHVWEGIEFSRFSYPGLLTAMIFNDLFSS